LLCERNQWTFTGLANATPYVKDAFHAYLIAGHGAAVNPAKVGTKAAMKVKDEADALMPPAAQEGGKR
jgi:hypothetical protein